MMWRIGRLGLEGQQRGRNDDGAGGENRFPNLGESANYNSVVRRRVQVDEAAEKLSQVLLRVNLVLQNHLDHRMPEIQVRIVGVFLDGHALAAASADASEGEGGSRLGVGVGDGEGRRFGIGGVGEVMVVWGFGRWLWFEVEEI